MNELNSKTVKELREIAKEHHIKHWYNLKKSELINEIERLELVDKAIDLINNPKTTKTTDDYVNDIQPDTLIAFSHGSKALSGKFTGKVQFKVTDGKPEAMSYEVVTLKGSYKMIKREDILWVKTGSRWPRWVYEKFGKKGEECKEMN